MLARDLAEEAGRLLLELRARGGDPDVLRKAGDRLSHEFLVAELNAQRPHDAVLSEEGIDDKARLNADRVWIVDPWTGRGSSARRGAPTGPCTWRSGKGIKAASPLVRWRSRPRARCWIPQTRPRAPADQPQPPGKPLKLVVSRSRAPQLVYDVANIIDAVLVPCGSAGAKVATVITGQTDAYLHAGGFYEWDTAAPVAVAVDAGFHVSRIDGSDVRYNRDNPLLPDILVCRPAIAGLLLAAIREATHAI